MSRTETNMTAELVANLDEQYPQWSMWRTGMKQWAVRLTNDHTNDIFCADTIEGALRQAVDFVPLPTIPRKPVRYYRSDITAVRVGGKWELLHQGRSMHVGNIATKRVAEVSATGFARRSEQAVEQWEQAYGAIASGVEGVDFRYRA